MQKLLAAVSMGFVLAACSGNAQTPGDSSVEDGAVLDATRADARSDSALDATRDATADGAVVDAPRSDANVADTGNATGNDVAVANDAAVTDAGSDTGAVPCVSGSCSGGRTCCSGQCVDLQTDINNCGACGSPAVGLQSNRCAAGHPVCGTMSGECGFVSSGGFVYDCVCQESVLTQDYDCVRMDNLFISCN